MSINKINFRNFKALVTEFKKDSESVEYDACSYTMGESKVIYRKAHKTPTKVGQFVTLWIRGSNGIIKPFDMSDDFDIVMIYVTDKKKRGLFIFNKMVLNVHNIISGDGKAGKIALRIYPPWVQVSSPIAIKSQKWQLEYFILLN